MPNNGAWTYPGMDGDRGDKSNSQFALLALHEAERVGVAASEQTWRLAKKYWERCQNTDGSWGYTCRLPVGTGSMTCAGITSLVIAADRVQPSDARAIGDHIECCLARPPATPTASSGPSNGWGNITPSSTIPNDPVWTLYYLYGLERAGRLTARRFIPLPPGPDSPAGPTGIAKGPTTWSAPRTASRALEGRAS